MTDLIKQFAAPEDLAQLQAILRRLPHPDGAALADELGRPLAPEARA